MSCETEKASVWPSKDPEETLDYAVDFEPFLTRFWERGTTYTTSTRVRPTRPNGFEYECTSGGQSAQREPIWPTTLGATKTDGSITWTCRAVSSSSLTASIDGTPTWEADGVTISGETVSDSLAIAYISGGTDGEDYSVQVIATMTDGTIRAKTVILPVRVPVRVCD